MFKVDIIGDFKLIASGESDRLAAHNRAAVEDATEYLKQRLRAQTIAARLGEKLAKAWRSNVYPRKSVSTMNPAGLVSSNAEKLHYVFSVGATIRSKSGRYLAIPLATVPFADGAGRHRRRMTPVEVEARFNNDLKFMETSYGGILYMDNLLEGKKAGTFRQATSRRLRQGRETRRVIFFNLIKQATIRPRIDLQGAASIAQQRLYNNLVSMTS